jgi:hypothetical protein
MSAGVRKISRNGVSCTTGDGKITFVCVRHDLTVVLSPDDPACGRRVHRFVLDHEDCTGGQPAVIDLVRS